MDNPQTRLTMTAVERGIRRTGTTNVKAKMNFAKSIGESIGNGDRDHASENDQL